MAGNGERANDDERYLKTATAGGTKGRGVIIATTTKEEGGAECIKLSAVRKKNERHNELCYCA